MVRQALDWPISASSKSRASGRAHGVIGTILKKVRPIVNEKSKIGALHGTSDDDAVAALDATIEDAGRPRGPPGCRRANITFYAAAGGLLVLLDKLAPEGHHIACPRCPGLGSAPRP
jgi:hypothetical protein